MTTGTIEQLARAIPWGTCLLVEQSQNLLNEASEALEFGGQILLAILQRGP